MALGHQGGGSTGGPSQRKQMVAFVSHGSPMVALADDDYTRALRRFGAEAPRPRAVVCVSAHWQAPGPVRVSAAPRPSLIYDFFGFPPELYQLAYPAPGAPDLAAEVAARLADGGVPAVLDPARGLDHGVWVPLRLLYPEADVPVVAVSLPVPGAPADLLRAGAALEPLRDRDVLLLGSGGIVHNLGRLHAEDAPVEAWARAFDDWVRARLDARDLEALVAYRRGAPHAALAAPTTEHFDPLFVVAGSTAGDDRVVDVYQGFRHGTLSMRSLAFQPPAGRAAVS